MEEGAGVSRLRLAIGALLLLGACGIKAPPKPPVRQPQPPAVSAPAPAVAGAGAVAPGPEATP